MALMEEHDRQFREVLSCGIIAADGEVDLCRELVGGRVLQDDGGRPRLVDDRCRSGRSRLRPWAGSGGRESGAGTDRRRDLCRAPARAQNQETQAAGSEACASPRFYRHGPATTGVIPGIPKSLTGDGLGGRGSWATLWIPVFGS